MAKRVNEFEVIQFVGLSKLKAVEQATVQELATDYFSKIKRGVNNLTNLRLHIKTHDKEGNRKKYSVNLIITVPAHEFVSNRAADWELPRVVHKAFQDVLKQIKHTLHTDVSRPSRR